MRTWGQYKISSYCSCVWCESRESEGRGSLRFPCVTPVVETSSHRVTFRNLSNINNGAPLQKQSTGLTCFRRKAPPQTSEWIPNTDPIRGDVILGMGGLQGHGIGSRKLVYKELVEVQTNYKKSYFWWFGNPACGDSGGRNQTEKDIVYLLVSLDGMENNGDCYLVCRAPVNDWANAGSCWSLIHMSVILILWGAGPILRNGCGI